MAIPSDYQVKVNTTTGAAATVSNDKSKATNPNDVSVYGTDIVKDPSTSAAKNTGATSSSQAQVLAMVTQLVSGISQLTDANSNTLASSYKSQYDLIKSMAGDIDVDSLVRQQMQGMADNQKEKVSQILGVSQSNNTNAANNTNNAFGSMMGSSSNPLDSFSNMVGNLITQKLAQAFGGSGSNKTNNANNGGSDDGIKVTDTSDCSNPKLADTFNHSFKGALAGKGSAIVEAAKKYGIDPKLLGAIVANESGWGTSSASKNKNNLSGTMDSSGMNLKQFDSVEDCLDYTAKNLKNNYIDEGRTTISSIGAKYCPVGAANDPTGMNSGWVPTVSSIYNQFAKDIA